MDGFIACFDGLDDPRTGNAGRHDLLEILMIALCTVLCGGQSAVDMAEFAEDKEAFLRGFLTLEHGPPSHDTFSRVLRRLDPDQFRACFQRFMARFAEAAQGVVAIDGKVLRRSFDAASGKSALHIVTAWGCDQRLVLAQIATDAKSNEITAVPRLLEMLSLKGTIVTVDALICQRAIARRIVEQGGDYVLALKGNQATLHSDVTLFLDDPETRPTDVHTTVDGDHGRIETRTCTVSTDIAWLQEVHDWPGLNAIGKVIAGSAGGISPPAAHRTVRNPLDLHGSSQPLPCHLAMTVDAESDCSSRLPGWRPPSLSWVIRFAPRSLQALRRSYRMIRPRHAHRYFPPSCFALIRFSLGMA
jgi:predicted transposase YbfD/YdcC